MTTVQLVKKFPAFNLLGMLSSLSCLQQPVSETYSEADDNVFVILDLFKCYFPFYADYFQSVCFVLLSDQREINSLYNLKTCLLNLNIIVLSLLQVYTTLRPQLSTKIRKIWALSLSRRCCSSSPCTSRLTLHSKLNSQFKICMNVFTLNFK
jgi:hypothetical protein